MKIGQRVTRVPQTLDEYDKKTMKRIPHRPMRGKVIYIHPKGRFHTVEFESGVRECFVGVED